MVSIASSSVTSITSSTRETSNTPGIKPSPIPCIWWRPGSWPRRADTFFGSTATIITSGLFDEFLNHYPEIDHLKGLNLRIIDFSGNNKNHSKILSIIQDNDELSSHKYYRRFSYPPFWQEMKYYRNKFSDVDLISLEWLKEFA